MAKGQGTSAKGSLKSMPTPVYPCIPAPKNEPIQQIMRN